MLTQEELKLHLHYDPATGNFTRYKETLKSKDGFAGCLDAKGYRVINVKGKVYKAHRLAWLYEYGCWPEKEIDHINGIKNDNRLSNLRSVSSSENKWNKRKPQGSNPYLGVSKQKHGTKYRWRAEIVCFGVRKHLGHFKTPEEASIAYQNAKKTLHRI